MMDELGTAVQNPPREAVNTGALTISEWRPERVRPRQSTVGWCVLQDWE